MTTAINISPNDDAQTVRRIRADRHRARKISQQAWLDWLNDELPRYLGYESATEAEIAALDQALKTPGSEPQQMLARDFAKREVPYYVAGSLASWVVRQRRVAAAVTSEVAA